MFFRLQPLVFVAALLIAEPHVLAQDPAAYPNFEERLARARAFKTIALHEPVAAHAPFTIYAQKKIKETGDPTKVAAATWGEWLAHTNRVLDELYLGPLVRAPREGYDAAPLIVLGSRGDYSNYFNTRRSAGRYTAGISEYDSDLNAAVTYQGAGTGFWRTYPILHDLVIARLAAVAEQPLAELWIYDGLATYLSYHHGHGPEAIDVRSPHRPFLEWLEGLWNDGARMERTWLHAGELFRVRGEAGLRALPQVHAKDPKTLTPEDKTAIRYQFELESWLLVHWAHATREGAKRDAFRAYLDAALDGRGGAEVFAGAMDLADVDALDRELREHAMRLYRAEFQRDIRRGGAPPVRVDPASTAAEAEAADPAAARESALADARAVLAAGPEGDVEILASALWLARVGRLDRAVEELDRAGDAQDADARARLERARVRIAALLALREAAFARIAEEGGKLRLVVAPDEKATLRVEAYAEGVLTFGSNSADVTERAAEEIPTEEWISALGKRTSEFGPEWLRGYGLLLAEDKRAARYLDDAGPEARAILDDAERGLPGLLALGRAHATLRELAEPPASADASAAEATVDTIRALVADAGGLPPVERRKDALRALARASLEVLFAARGLEEVLGAEVERLDDGRVRLTYGFDDVAEGDDFFPDHDYMLKDHERIAERARAEPTWGVRDGSFGGAGWVCFRHVLELEGVQRVQAKVWFGQPPTDVTYAPELLIGMCDDRKGSFVAVRNTCADLYVFDRAGHTLATDDAPISSMDVHYVLELEHDGKEATTFCDGEEKQSHEVRTRTSGGVFLWSHSYNPTLFRDLVIEGRPTAASLERLGDAWIGDELTALGL